jgi:CoA:oxalate CoA-transferase
VLTASIARHNSSAGDERMVLEGVRVVEFSNDGSAAYCGKVLAELGAEVIKVESPNGGDFRRRYGPFIGQHPDPERSGGFIYLNAGKKSITLNRGEFLGQRIALQLTTASDIVLLDTGDPVAEDEDACQGTTVVFAGTSHPRHKHFRVTDLVGYALSGYLYVDGAAEREPLKGGGEQPAHTAANYAILAILAQRLKDDGQRRPRRILVPMAECMATMHWYTTTMWTYMRIKKRRIGNRLDTGHPISLYECSDGWVAIAGAGAWEAICALVGRGELAEDERFGDGWSRLQNADEVDEVITAYTLPRSREEVMSTLQELRIPCGYVSTPEDLLNDPQYCARGFWQQIQQPGMASLKTCGPPFKSVELEMLGGLKAPHLGEHTFEILEELGFTPDERRRLRWDSVV